MMKIDISMVAPSRVGKTSLLAAMYEYIKPAFNNTNCYIIPVDDTVSELQERKTELCGMFANSHALEFKGGGIGASIARREYRFRIGKNGKQPDVEIAFVDLPGGLYTTKDPQKKEEINTQIRKSFATILPIDIAALFAEDGSIHQKVNQPGIITTLYKSVLTDFKLGEKKLVIIVPIKCEKYIQQPNGEQKIFERILQDDDYQSLLSYLTSPGLKNYISIAICPVETVGGIHVVGVERDNYGNPENILRRVSSYSPNNCHLPLLYLFFIILQMAQDSQNQNPIINFFRQIFKLDLHLKQALEKMVKDFINARSKRAIRIVQGPLQNCNLSF